MKEDSLLTWDSTLPKRKGIYLLTDEDGKHYVGQSKNVRNRIYQHKLALNYAHQHPDEWICYNQRLIRAARDGMHFKASVLRLFEDDANPEEMTFWESYFIVKNGGYYLSYNINPPYGVPYPYKDLCAYPKGCRGRYVLKPKDARKVESFDNAQKASAYLQNITDYINIDERLIREMEGIPNGLKTLI